MQNSPTKQMSGLASEIDLFTRHVETIGDAMVGLVIAVQMVTKQCNDELRAFETENCEVIEAEDRRLIRIPIDSQRDWKRIARRHDQFRMARSLLPRSLLVSLISQYDAYVGRLLRAVFVHRPEILNSSERKISFETLSSFASIDSVREYILEKEVESVLRSSHIEQFRTMEQILGIPLTKGLDVWPSFVELTERRNLFVHTDGIVSSQYLSVCRKHNCQLEGEAKEGARLGVSQEYFAQAHEVVYEVGVKLGHVLWRKMFPGERESADGNFLKISYDLIDHGKYDLAVRLLDFACTFNKYSSEVQQLMLEVNRAQAYQWKGDKERCRELMRAVDWSAKGDEFKLAAVVLAEDWEHAARMMKQIGSDGAVQKVSYRDWPLFRDFRKQALFLTTYREVFGEEFKTEMEQRQSPITEGNADGNSASTAKDDDQL